MKNLMKLISSFKKNKSAIEAGGFSVVVKIVITLIIGGLFLVMVLKAMNVF